VECLVYKGDLNPDTYLYVPDEAALADLPGPVLKYMGELIQVMSLELTPGRKLARASVESVVTSIAQQGFYLQMPPPKEPSMARFLNPKED
jgi:uncharacterized protein YcgL (UPF0745 family)